MPRAALTRRQLLLGGTAAGAAAAIAASNQFGGGTRRTLPVVPPSPPIEAIDAPLAPPFRSRPDLRIPPLKVRLAEPGVAPGLILLAPYNAPGDAQAGAMIVDNDGRVVWEQPLPKLVTADFRVQTYLGAPVLTWWDGKIVLGHGAGGYVIADTAYRPIARVNAGNGYMGDLHEFLLTDRGTALLTSYSITEYDLGRVGGRAHGTIQDALFQEVDVATGKVLLEWHSLDHIPITESYWPLSGDWDYVHLNSIAVDHDDNLLVSSRNTHTIYKLDRATGEIIWRLGGRSSDFSIESAAMFAWQHDARRHPDGTVTMFDNGYARSRALVLHVDERGRHAAFARSYTRGTTHALSQGNVQVLPNGNVFVGWGAQPYVSEFTAEGELIFDAELDPRYESYRAYRTPWGGQGAGVPEVAASRGERHCDVYVSWNGDTRVTHWIAHAGTDLTTPVPVARVSRGGFETGLRVPATYNQLRLSGVDASGRELTTTGLIAL
jgi:hypothetical protein